MHKYLRYGLIACILVVLSILSAVAVEGTPPLTQTVPISGNVAPYAVVEVVTEPMDFGIFSGVPNEELGPADNAVFRVVTNTTLTLTFSGSDLSHVSIPGSTIQAAYRASRVIPGPAAILGHFNRIYPGYTPVGNLVLPSYQPPLTTRTYEVIGWAKTGPNVSSQAAGNYSATITLTVSAP